MAKGSSVFAAPKHGEEVAGEYRRFVAQPDRGRVAGTRDADEAAPMGECHWHEHMESRMRRESHVRFGGRAGETYRSKGEKALRSDPTLMSGRGRDSCTWRWCWMPGAGGWWAGRWPATCAPSWSWMR